MDSPVRVIQVCKRYRRHSHHRPATLQETIAQGFRGWRRADVLWALSDVSFEAPAGSMTGIIGANGAGKSTLLRLIGRVGRPDEGRIETAGRLAAMIDLGTGFHSDLTGRENVFINGVISGMTRREVSQRFDEMVAFAELAAFIDSPLRTYSSGMWMRLAFAVATAVRPDILLVDEVLAVGDSAFQEKCLARIRHFEAQGSAILLVSHSASLVEERCDRVLWLAGGRVVEFGPAAEVTGHYLAETEGHYQRRASFSLPSTRAS